MKRTFITILLALTIGLVALTASSRNAQTTGNSRQFNSIGRKISLAYVESARSAIPDPHLFSHLVYAFCEFNDDNDGVIVSNPDKLRKMSQLKNQNPDLKIILGIGGYKKEGFSEMTADKKKRKAFVNQCKAIINDYNLDGLDLDWEFPGTTAGGHTAAPDDAKNYGTLVKDLRKAFGKDKWISFYSNNSAAFIDFKRMLPYVDYVNVSGYNLSVPKEGKPLYHQSTLFPSKACGDWSVSKSIARHIAYGVPPHKILLGMPFFGRGIEPCGNYFEMKSVDRYKDSCELIWDDTAKVPYFRGADGNLKAGFDNEASLKIKSDFIRSNGLAGGFIWNYDSDYPDHRLAKTLKQCLLQNYD